MSITVETFSDFTVELAQAQTTRSVWKYRDGFQVALIMTGVILLCFVIPLFYFLFLLTKDDPPSSMSTKAGSVKRSHSRKTDSSSKFAIAKTHRSVGSKKSSKPASHISKVKSVRTCASQKHSSHKSTKPLPPKQSTSEQKELKSETSVILLAQEGKRESLKQHTTPPTAVSPVVSRTPQDSATLAKRRDSTLQGTQVHQTLNTITDDRRLSLSGASLLTTSSEAVDMMSRRGQMLSQSGVSSNIPTYRTSVHKMDPKYYANDSESSWIVRGLNQCEDWRKQTEVSADSEKQTLVKMDSLMSIEKVAGIIAAKDLKALHLARPPSFDAIAGKPTLDNLNKIKQVDDEITAQAKKQTK